MSDRVALVMGGGAGTGRATALAFAREGARVVVADINEKGAQKTLALVRDSGGNGIAIQADMSRSADIRGVIAATRETFGALHWVSNNAARAPDNKSVTELAEDEWDSCMSVTLRGVWLCMKHQLPLIEASGGGAIVNVASLSGMRGDAHQAAYAAAKGGVLALSKSVASEYARRGVRVNTVCPGGINSKGMDFFLKSMPELREKTLNIHAMGRLAEPQEIADAVVYLCSDRASFITGHDLVVDGGVLVRSNVIDL
ncbi:MAG: glucose 1-dehydrogenase [Gammaproteobacteria bacterium]|nr:glucose 1-dehydrogenase [Gammaproteobacteria bacterium]MBP6052456.1 glucose 1-dehydrogenase [Pseudomonadales bacterium]MBK6583197.1 glucose 1-dehydrogenase [Gammaproteobacteria bacterium]MBK7170660.1 glucose 1-dehydrogenase [Gammaproteobacteria bacterium]MBK7519331.1 glucose 1-dehydrogenase [Gammaproteobacteria bacterium]